MTSYPGLRSNGQELCENSRHSKQSFRQSGCFFLATFPELSPLPALGQTLLRAGGQAMAGGGYVWTTVKKKKKKREQWRGRRRAREQQREWWGETLTEGAEAVHRSWTLGSSRLVFWENPGPHLHVSLLSQLLAGSGQSTRAEAMGEPVKRNFPLNKVLKVESLNSQHTRVSVVALGRGWPTPCPSGSLCRTFLVHTGATRRGQAKPQQRSDVCSWGD